MRVVVSGTEYSFEALNKASLLDLIELKKQTGLTVDDLGKMIAAMEDAAKAAEGDDDPGASFLADEGNLLVLAVMIWLSRRRAGERSLKFEDSADVPLSDVQLVPDDTDGEQSEEAPDPS